MATNSKDATTSTMKDDTTPIAKNSENPTNKDATAPITEDNNIPTIKDDLPARPSPHHRRAIVFPEHDAQPYFVWLETYTTNPAAKMIELAKQHGLIVLDQNYGVPKFDPPSTAFRGPNLEAFKGPLDKTIGLSLLVLGNKGHGQALNHGIYAGYHDSFKADGSGPNKCLGGLIGQEMAEMWKGPLICFGMSKVAVSSCAVDLDVSDLMPALEGLKTEARARNAGRMALEGVGFQLNAMRLAAMGGFVPGRA